MRQHYDSKIERWFAAALNKHHVKYAYHKKFGPYEYDFYLKGLDVVVELNGGDHYGLGRNNRSLHYQNKKYDFLRRYDFHNPPKLVIIPFIDFYPSRYDLLATAKKLLTSLPLTTQQTIILPIRAEESA